LTIALSHPKLIQIARKWLKKKTKKVRSTILTRGCLSIEEKNEKLKKREEERLAQEMAECSFKPKIDKSSESFMSNSNKASGHYVNSNSNRVSRQNSNNTHVPQRQNSNRKTTCMNYNLATPIKENSFTKKIRKFEQNSNTTLRKETLEILERFHESDSNNNKVKDMFKEMSL